MNTQLKTLFIFKWNVSKNVFKGSFGKDSLLSNIPLRDDNDELFCGTVDQPKTFSLISSWDSCQRSSLSLISDMLQAGLEPVQNLSSGFVEWSCAVVITTIPWHNKTTETCVNSILKDISRFKNTNFENSCIWQKKGIKFKSCIKKFVEWLWDHLFDLLWPKHFSHFMKNSGKKWLLKYKPLY